MSRYSQWENAYSQRLGLQSGGVGTQWDVHFAHGMSLGLGVLSVKGNRQSTFLLHLHPLVMT